MFIKIAKDAADKMRAISLLAIILIHQKELILYEIVKSRN
jgi:hypothetical protein